MPVREHSLSSAWDQARRQVLDLDGDGTGSTGERWTRQRSILDRIVQEPIAYIDDENLLHHLEEELRTSKALGDGPLKDELSLWFRSSICKRIDLIVEQEAKRCHPLDANMDVLLQRLASVDRQWDICMSWEHLKSLQYQQGSNLKSANESKHLAFQHALKRYGEPMRRFAETCLARPTEYAPRAKIYRDSLQQLDMDIVLSRSVLRAAHSLVKHTVQERGGETRQTRNQVPSNLARCLDGYTSQAFSALNDWIKREIVPLVIDWIAPGADQKNRIAIEDDPWTTGELLQTETLQESLQETMSICLGYRRSKQLFDIVVDFPESTPALEDLHRCIAVEADTIKRAISRDLDRSLQDRLLHAGASTKSILQVYTHLIRALRIADPSGVVLSHVIGPVRAYLRRRPDTVPIIVSSLLGQSRDFTLLSDMMRDPGQGSSAPAPTSADLSAMYDDDEPHLGRPQPGNDSLVVDLSQHQLQHNSHQSSYGGTAAPRSIMVPIDDPDWAPRPIDAGPDYRQSRKSDVIAMIISIFDDEAGFVEALERSTAEQIIKVENYDARNEYEINENLKRRFGDASLGKCDTIIKDVKKSQRYDRSIHIGSSSDGKEVPSALVALHPLIISRQFWPDLEDEGVAPPSARKATASTMFANMSSSAVAMTSTASSLSSKASALSLDTPPPGGSSLKMPGQFHEAQQRYVEKFKEVADMKTLKWMSARGRVRLELEMDDGRRIEEDVVPLQAAVLECVNNALDPTKVKAEEETESEESKRANAQDMARELECDEKAVSEALSFWVAKGIIGEVAGQPGLYRVLDDQTRAV